MHVNYGCLNGAKFSLVYHMCSVLSYSYSVIFFVFNFSSYLYSVLSYLYSVNLLYIHSVLSNLHSVNYIQSSYIYSVPSYLYLVSLYIFSLILHVFSRILFIYIQSSNIHSVKLYIFSPILYYMYSVSSYIFSLILFMFSQLICIHSYLICIQFRRSRPEVFCKKGVLRNFAKFTGKHLCQGLFLNRVAGLSPATLLKQRLCHRCFPVNFAKFLRTNTSGGCFCQFTFIFCEHVQGAVRHVENLIKIYSFLKESEFMSCRIIFHKEIKQTKILSKRDIFALVLFLYYSNDLVFGSTS